MDTEAYKLTHERRHKQSENIVAYSTEVKDMIIRKKNEGHNFSHVYLVKANTIKLYGQYSASSMNRSMVLRQSKNSNNKLPKRYINTIDADNCVQHTSIAWLIRSITMIIKGKIHHGNISVQKLTQVHTFDIGEQ